MAELVRCKACAYVAVPEVIRKIFPVRVASVKMLAPLISPILLIIKRITDLCANPMMAHFPEAFAATPMIALCGDCAELLGAKLPEVTNPG